MDIDIINLCHQPELSPVNSSFFVMSICPLYFQEIILSELWMTFVLNFYLIY